MKISQDLIVFDLEATSSQSEEGFQENDNIIQIGAVYLKRIENKRYEIASRFNKIVRSRDEQITPFIEELTGISNEIASKASYFDIVGKEFSNWASANGSIKSTRLCAWGTYFDVPLLRKQYQKEKILYPFSGTAYDVKTWTALWFMLSGRRAEKMSVGNVAKLMNTTPFSSTKTNFPFSFLLKVASSIARTSAVMGIILFSLFLVESFNPVLSLVRVTEI